MSSSCSSSLQSGIIAHLSVPRNTSDAAIKQQMPVPKELERVKIKVLETTGIESLELHWSLVKRHAFRCVTL